MQLFNIRRHTIGSGGVIVTPVDGYDCYMVPSDNDGTQQRALEVMTRESRREAAGAATE